MDASCQCGKLTATIDDGAEPMTVLCHCLDCQRRTGSPFGTIAYYPADAVSVSGQATEYSRVGDSGLSLVRGFCPTCGSAVYVKAERFPEVIGVPVGALQDPSFPAPIRSVYEQSKHAWVLLPDGMTHHPQGRATSW